VRCHRTAVIMWHCGVNVCASSVNSHKQRKRVHSQVAVPLTVHRNSKLHILNSNTPFALHCVCQQGSLQFLSPYCITVCVLARQTTVPVTIMHYSVCASKDVYSSCHHTALKCVCQQGCQQSLSTYCITVWVPAKMSTVLVTIMHFSVCASKVLYSSCHHTALQCVCQQGCLQFLSQYCIKVRVPRRLSTVPVTILH